MRRKKQEARPNRQEGKRAYAEYSELSIPQRRELKKWLACYYLFLAGTVAYGLACFARDMGWFA